MELMIGAGLALALLYFWLLGHWFARVVVFLLLAVVGFIAGAALASASPNPPTFALVLFGLIGAALAWPLSGIPIYYWRREMRLLAQAVYGRASPVMPTAPPSAKTTHQLDWESYAQHR